MIDFCNTQDAVVLEQDVDLIMQQIEILFDTRPGEVIGENTFGTKLDTYLFNPNIGNSMVETELTDYIRQNVELFDWDINVSVDFLVGTQHDIMLLKVSFYKNGEIYTKQYKVSQGSIDYL